MSSDITAINLGGVNCYLLRSDAGFVLIDTGFQTRRNLLDQQIEKAGCKPGDLKLILLTHGDVDHVGNCAHLRAKFGAPCAIHAKDAPMAADGNMGANRKAKPDRLSLIFKLLGLFTRRLAAKNPLETFNPDLILDEGFDLGAYGLNARVLHLPGHSKGSIGVLTGKGELFCGDMFYNVPGFRSIDDLSDYTTSLKKLSGLKVDRVFPGHGKPFSAEEIHRKTGFLGGGRRMMEHDQRQANYGNWVSIRIILAAAAVGVVFALIGFFSPFLLIPSAVFLLIAAYFALARYLFSDRGADVQKKIQSLVLEKLEWDGNGRALDIGCGNAALAIGVAKRFPLSRVVGTDSWGGSWEYSRKVCEENARAEGVGGRVTFQKASASSLPFADGEFDAIVSNLVFHEVKDTTDKTSLIKEALRVLRKGGKFALQDLFYIERYYGKPEELIKTVKDWGIESVQFIETKSSPFIPSALKLPFMVGTLGLIVGKK